MGGYVFTIIFGRDITSCWLKKIVFFVVGGGGGLRLGAKDVLNIYLYYYPF